MQAEAGSKISFDKVLLIDDNGAVTIGAPAIEGAEISAKILEHLKGDKVIVFKKKRRKGYKVKNGHRQYLTEIQIEGISANGSEKKEVVSTKKAAPKKVEEVVEVVEKVAKKPAAKKTKEETK